MGMRDEMKNDLKNTHEDYTYSVMNTAVSSIPVFGNVASEIFNMVIIKPLEKRKEKWMLKIAESLEELQDKVEDFDIHKLCDNELFISVLNRASQLALSNHQEEKMLALKNAVINTALNITIDENEEMMFLNMIDTMTPWHLKIIYYFKFPEERVQEFFNKPIEHFITNHELTLKMLYPELESKTDFINLIVSDLFNKGIIKIKDLHTSIDKLGFSILTKYGQRFFDYIKKPQV